MPCFVFVSSIINLFPSVRRGAWLFRGTQRISWLWKNRSPKTNWALAQLGDISYWAFSALDTLMQLPISRPDLTACVTKKPALSRVSSCLCSYLGPSLGSLSSIPILDLRLPRTNEAFFFFPLSLSFIFFNTLFFSFSISLSFFSCFSSSFSLPPYSNPLIFLWVPLWLFFSF